MNTVLAIRTLRSRLGNFVIGLFLAVVLGVLLHTSLSVTAFAATEATSPDALVNISGKVTDENGQPLAGIIVSVFVQREYDRYWQVVRSISTSATGEYRAIALGAGIYRVRFNDNSAEYESVYYRGSATIEDATDILLTGNPASGIDIVLHFGSSLTGAVSILGEQVAPGGYVAVMQKVAAQWLQVTTAAISTTGEYSVTGLPAGVYRIYASTYIAAPDYFVEYFGGYYGGTTIESAQDVTVTVGETKTNLNIDTGFGRNEGSISGKVTSKNAALAGIKVDIYRSYYEPNENYNMPATIYTYTNSDGHFAISGLADGYYHIGFSDPSEIYAVEYYNDRRYLPRSEYLSIENGKAFSNINVSLVQAGTISGTLRYVSGAPATNVMVQYSWKNQGNWELGPSNQTFTDQSGNYLLKNVWTGAYRLLFQSPIYGTEIYGAPNYYDYSSPDYYNFDLATTITIEGGSKVTNINQIIGPDFVEYLPVIAK